MTDEGFDAFVAAAVEELARKQDELVTKYGFGSCDGFLFDQPSGTLKLIDEAGATQARATVIPLGSYAEGSGTWKWAWANDSVAEPLRAQSRKVRELAELTGMDLFRDPAFEAAPAMAWQAAAMAVKHLGALGCYKARIGRSDLYMAVMTVETVN